jgi:hypothetical protein
MRTSRLASLLAIGAITAMTIAPGTSATPRSGELHITKDCGDYQGQPGQHCTITESNLKAIPVGARIVYTSGVVDGVLDSDITIEAGPGNVARGHVTLDFNALPALVVLSGGTGKFTHIQANVVVTPVVPPSGQPRYWHWDGTYAFGDGA